MDRSCNNLICNATTNGACAARTLQWRHNEPNGVSNHQCLDCFLNRRFMRRSKKTSKLRVNGPCEGNAPVAGGFPSQRASNARNVFIWWRHHKQPAQDEAFCPPMSSPGFSPELHATLGGQLDAIRTDSDSDSKGLFKVTIHRKNLTPIQYKDDILPVK